MYRDPGILPRPHDYINKKAEHELKMKAEFEMKQRKRIQEEREWVYTLIYFTSLDMLANFDHIV